MEDFPYPSLIIGETMARYKITVWDKIEEEMLNAHLELSGRDDPFFKMIIAIILQAGSDRDLEYLHSERFEYDCSLLIMEPEIVMRVIKMTWGYLDKLRNDTIIE